LWIHANVKLQNIEQDQRELSRRQWINREVDHREIHGIA